MRQPQRQKKFPRSQTSVVQSYPAPVGGWNARDALADMRIKDAVVLDNWFPETNYLGIRGGYANHATGTNGNIKTLAVYNTLTGTSKMFGFTASNGYDVSSAGAVGASIATVTNGFWQYVNYGDGGVQYLVMVNGVDKALYYNGTTWIVVDDASSPALTGIATTSLIHVNIHKERLYFIQKNSLSFWYLAAGAVGGALTEFPLDGYFRKGGYLLAMATWTIDSGSGVDDLAVFITSEGQVAVYAGTNPGAAATWSLVGIYDLPKPLGRRCFTKMAGDLAVITESGVYPLTAALKEEDERAAFALSFKIQNAFAEASRLYGENFGWEATFYPAHTALVVNIPVTVDGIHYQYVMNTLTKAWTRFKGWNAETFAVFNKELYFATGNKVVKAWTGKVDGTLDIEVYGKQAFSYFGSPGELKQFVMYRPVLAVNGSLGFLTDIDVDFADAVIAGTATYSVTAGGQWDVDLWDQCFWAAGMEIKKEWTSPAQNMGYAAAGKIKIATNSLDVQWVANDMMYVKGGVI